MKYRILILYVLMVAFCPACHREQEIPAYVMDRESLTEMLTEAHLMESYYLVMSDHRYDSVRADVRLSYDTLFARYHTTKEDFDSTMAYYARQEGVLVEIFERVEQNLNDMMQ